MREADLGLTKRESFITVSQPEYPTVPFMRGTVYAFSSGVRDEIQKNAGHRCELCGSPHGCNCHHRFPDSLSGKNSSENGIYLCRTHHLIADRAWQERGVIINRDGSFTPIEERLDLCNNTGNFLRRKLKLIHIEKRTVHTEHRKQKRR